MIRLLIAATAVMCLCFAGGCGSSQPDEKQMHDILSKPPERPKSHGVGQKRLDQQGGAPAAGATN
jgi:hypothetical protein